MMRPSKSFQQGKGHGQEHEILVAVGQIDAVGLHVPLKKTRRLGDGSNSAANHPDAFQVLQD